MYTCIAVACSLTDDAPRRSLRLRRLSMPVHAPSCAPLGVLSPRDARNRAQSSKHAAQGLEALYRMQPAPSVISRLSDAPETITLRVGAAGGLTRGHVPAVCAQLRQRRPAVRLGRTDPLAAETLDELAERSSPVATETASGLLEYRRCTTRAHARRCTAPAGAPARHGRIE